jgi:hypothetical protein
MSVRDFSLFIVFLSASACSSPRVEGVDVSAARVFYRQPTSEQQKTFRQHTLQDQLGLFFFGNQVRHPPALYLAQCFALNGAPAVELLRAKLKVESNDLTVRDIAMLLATIDAMGKYDVAGDAQLMAALRSRVTQMRDDGWRDTAEREIASIGHERNERASRAPECG